MFCPSFDASSDWVGWRSRSSLATDFQILPSSFETRMPALVAAYHASCVKFMSLTWYAESVGAFALGAGFFTSTVVFLPLTIFVTFVGAGASGASCAYNPALTHLPPVSSYFIQPPLFSEAHHPVGAA